MTAPWQAGKTYPPGSLVVPASAPAIEATQATNGSFEDGATGWDFSGHCVLQTGYGYNGNNSCVNYGAAHGGGGDGEALNQAHFLMMAGESISASCFIQQGASDKDHTRGWVTIHFYRADGSEIGTPTKGNVVNDGRGGKWAMSGTSAYAPAGTAYARCGIAIWQGSRDDQINGDNLVVSYARRAPPSGLVYKATQAAPGKSGATEPTWPATTGVTVVDNEVTWEGVIASRIVWEASPILKSGDTEPAWPDSDGGMVHDGTIDWQAVTPRIKDALCPHTKIVAVAANKVFAGDLDVVRFCATNDANDWTTLQDAGYLPTGLQAIGESNCSALALYRGNLACFTPSSLQIWQVDPDPSKMVFLDAVDGVGTTVARGHASVSGDLYFLAQLGVRSVSIAAGTANMAAGDIGTPIDTLIREDMASFTGEPLGMYLTSAGQYWLILGDHAWVFTYSPSAQIAAWSRYAFAFTVTDACVLGGQMYLRDAAHRLLKMDATAEQQGRPVQDAGQDFAVLARWPYMDFGTPGGNVRSMGFDVLFHGPANAAADGATSLAVGYDENAVERLTDAVVVLPDARAEDGFVPVEVTAPAISVQVGYTGPRAWELTQVNAYLSGSWRTP